MKNFRQLRRAVVVDRQTLTARWRVDRHVQLRDGHAVFSEGTGLVGAQHRGRTQGLNGGNAARQHLFFRQPPCTECRQHRQDHGKFLRQQGHGQRDAGQQRAQPVATQPAVGDDQEQTGSKGNHGQHAHQTRRLQLQRRALADKGPERRADAPDFAARAGCRDPRRAVAAHQQGARVEASLRLAARIRIGELEHRHRLACE